MPFAHRPDARIWWDQSGTGDPILLIMGHAYGADMWHRTAPELAASYRVIRFDNRGVGRSSDPAGPYSVPLMAEDALAVLDAAGAASAHVYGVSLGGAIALQLALDHPGRVRSLTLGCTAASAEGASRSALLTGARSVLPAAALNRMAWKLLYGPDTPACRRAEDQQIVRRTRCSGRGRRGQLSGLASFDVTGRLRGDPHPGAGHARSPGPHRPRRPRSATRRRHRRSPARDVPGRRSRLHHRRRPRRQPGGPALPRRHFRPSRRPQHRHAPGNQHGGDVTLTRAGLAERAERPAALFAGGRAGRGVQAHRVSTRPLARGERTPPRRPSPRRSDLQQRQTRRTTRRGNPAGSRLNDLDPQVLAIAPAWMADEEAPASGVTSDAEMK